MTLRTQVEALIPASIKPRLRRLYYVPIDAINRVRHGGMVPPPSINFIGGGDFLAIGREFRRYFVELGGLQPGDKVLDVGCGLGRMAVPLTEYLSTGGEYWGFDIVRQGIDWCERGISSRFPNFHFLYSDVLNQHYNPTGRTLARDYRFPFHDASFGFAFAASVFTHMLQPDVDNYLRELSRVLKIGGRALITVFLLNAESRALIGSRHSTLDFSYTSGDGCLTTNKDDPEAAIAYDEPLMKQLFRTHRLEPREIHYGSWCGRDRYLSYQDVVIASRTQ